MRKTEKEMALERQIGGMETEIAEKMKEQMKELKGQIQEWRMT